MDGLGMETAAKIDQPATAEQQRKPSGRPFPAGTSGNPLGPGIAKPRIAMLYDQMAADFEDLTGTERLRLQQAAVLLDRARHTKDHDIAVRASNAASRMLAALERKRKPKSSGAPWSPLRDRLARAGT